VVAAPLEQDRSNQPEQGMTRRPFDQSFVVIALLALALTTFADAADAQGRRGGGTGRGLFQAGFMMLDLDELNDVLVDEGYPSLEERFITLGGAGYGQRGRVLFGAEGHALLGEEESTADASRQITLNGGYGLFRLGILAFSESGFELVPAIGLGGGGMALQIAERSAPSFEDVLEDPARSSTLTTGMFVIDGSLGLNYRFDTSDRGERPGGILLGVQGGYTYSPWNSSWELDGLNSVAGGPDLQIEGYYVRLSIGGWGRGDRR
jgi:hypothetical protein